MQHEWRLSRPDGARPCLWCGAAQPPPPRVTRHKTRGAARVPGWQGIRRGGKRERSGRCMPLPACLR
jgi:hypothetical protein